jgi:hypothetical protein
MKEHNAFAPPILDPIKQTKVGLLFEKSGQRIPIYTELNQGVGLHAVGLRWQGKRVFFLV